MKKLKKKREILYNLFWLQNLHCLRDTLDLFLSRSTQHSFCLFSLLHSLPQTCWTRSGCWSEPACYYVNLRNIFSIKNPYFFLCVKCLQVLNIECVCYWYKLKLPYLFTKSRAFGCGISWQFAVLWITQVPQQTRSSALFRRNTKLWFCFLLQLVCEHSQLNFWINVWKEISAF